MNTFTKFVLIVLAMVALRSAVLAGYCTWRARQATKWLRRLEGKLQG
jgi:hypothetical protein